MNLRAAGVAACIIVAGVGGCSIGSPPRPDSAPPPAAPSPTTMSGGHSDDGREAAEPAAPTPQALDSINGYMRAWARPHLAPDVWIAGVLPYTTPEYGRLLATVNPANIPATTVTGAATVVASTSAALTVDVPTDAGPHRVTLIRRDDRWLVTGTQPQREKR